MNFDNNTHKKVQRRHQQLINIVDFSYFIWVFFTTYTVIIYNEFMLFASRNKQKRQQDCAL